MKKNFSRAISLLLCFVMVLVMTACGGGEGVDADSPYNVSKITIGSYYASSTTQGQALEKIKEYIEEKSGGTITVDLFPDASIGNEAELATALQDGSVDLTFGGGTGIGLYVPAVNVFESFFAYGDRYDEPKIFEAVKDDMAPAFEESGFTLLGYYREGPRNICATKPITKLSDISGAPFRAPATELYTSCIGSWGCNPIAMPLGDVYTSLQNGVVIGQEGPIELMISNKFYEQCKYITESQHVYNLLWVVFSSKNWGNLNDATKKLVQDAVDSSIEFQSDAWDAKAVDDVEFLKNEGCTFVQLENKDEWVDAVEKANKDFAEKNGELGMNIYNAIKELQEK